ncbi:MAG: 16S rRNA pseudouridine(516) synthase [Ruminococcus sp.]|nr:16S rRNA pseudouridine(516) synthase [Ruminococcus sp.]
MERLDKFISARCGLSRKDAQKCIKNGEVHLNGEVCRKADCKLNPDADAVLLRGQAVCADEHLYIMLNKPAGVVSATADKHDTTVLDILPPELRRRGLFPAGRLDKDTEGLLLITDDGDLAHRMLSPKKHVEKRYVAQLDGRVTPEMQQAFAAGVVFADGTKCRPAKLEVLPDSGEMSGIVTICEGKFHQVKKMFATVGRKVVHLQRISIGNLYLDSKLPIGSAKKLTKLDIDAIFLGNIH